MEAFDLLLDEMSIEDYKSNYIIELNTFVMPDTFDFKAIKQSLNNNDNDEMLAFSVSPLELSDSKSKKIAQDMQKGYMKMLSNFHALS